MELLDKNVENPFCMQRIKDIKEQSRRFLNRSYEKTYENIKNTNNNMEELEEKRNSFRGFFGFFSRISYKHKIQREGKLRDRFTNLLEKIDRVRAN